MGFHTEPGREIKSSWWSHAILYLFGKNWSRLWGKTLSINKKLQGPHCLPFCLDFFILLSLNSLSTYFSFKIIIVSSYCLSPNYYWKCQKKGDNKIYACKISKTFYPSFITLRVQRWVGKQCRPRWGRGVKFHLPTHICLYASRQGK